MNVSEVHRLVGGGGQRQQDSRFDLVDPVEHEDGACGFRFPPSAVNDPRRRVLVETRAGAINDQQDDVGVRPAPGRVTIARSSRRRGRKRPGVSMKTIWLGRPSAMPRMRDRVVCTLGRRW